MARSALFIDLAGTLVLRDPQTRRWVAWTGVAGLLHDLSTAHELHLTTGDSERGARETLAELEIAEHFTGIHAALPGGGKPFGALATALGVEPARCLALGDDPVNDTAGDSEGIVSLILRHETAQIQTARVRAVVAALASAEGFLGGFETALVNREPSAEPVDLAAADWPTSSLGPDVRLGWWQKTARALRPVVILTA